MVHHDSVILGYIQQCIYGNYRQKLKFKGEDARNSILPLAVFIIAEEFISAPNIDEDLLSTCSKLVPWSLAIRFLRRFRKGSLSTERIKRKKTVICCLSGIGRVVTPVSTMLEHVLMSCLNDMSEGRLEQVCLLYS